MAEQVVPVSSNDESQDESIYQVVRNSEEQYSIWRMDLDLPAGWVATGYEGTKSSCLQHIATVWTDMRPLSLRQAMLAGAQE